MCAIHMNLHIHTPVHTFIPHSLYNHRGTQMYVRICMYLAAAPLKCPHSDCTSLHGDREAADPDPLAKVDGAHRGLEKAFAGGLLLRRCSMRGKADAARSGLLDDDMSQRIVALAAAAHQTSAQDKRMTPTKTATSQSTNTVSPPAHNAHRRACAHVCGRSIAPTSIDIRRDKAAADIPTCAHEHTNTQTQTTCANTHMQMYASRHMCIPT